MKRILALLAVIGALSYASVANAQITFNVITDGSPQWPAPTYAGLGIAPDDVNGTNWNPLTVGYNTTAPIKATNIVSSLGVAFPGVSVTFSNVTAGGAQYTWNNTAGGAPPNPVNLMRTYTFFATYNVTVSGLAPGQYDFWYYGHGDAPNQTGTIRIGSSYRPGGYTNSFPTDANGRDLVNGGEGISYMTITNLTVGENGVFTFQVVNYLNAFQLRPSQNAGPAFVVTGTDGCSDVGVTPGIAGSVTTNDYMLYLNGAYVGPTVAGTGAALNFGVQTTVGTYTIVATNTATATSGLMYGNVRVYAPGVSIDTQPAAVSVVSNLPASFAVQATGDSLTYQWYKGGVAVTNGSGISGAQTPTLSIAAVQPGDAANYTVVVQNPCSGAGVTSSPPASLTVTTPRNLIWAGNNPGSDWNLIAQEFTLFGSPVAFQQGDNTTFDNSSSQQSVVIADNLTPTLLSVTGSKSYTFSGPNKITGVAQLVDSSSGTLTILNANDYTGGTIINSGATLQLGDGGSAANNGSLNGTVTVSSGATNNYAFAGSGTLTITLNNTLAGSGVVNCTTLNGSIIRSKGTASSTGFNGTINVYGFTALQGSASGAGDVFGKGSTVNILQDGGQAWLDPQGTAYDNTFNIQGKGRVLDTPELGAIRIFGATVIGPINMLADSRIGGSISGGTIRGAISGAYELEVLGTSIDSYNLQIGPTNGTHNYSSTRITAGIVTALNNGAISTGPLIIDTPGKLRLNGNNLSVASLTSVNSGTVTGFGAQIQNNSTTADSVLTVGSDNTSTTFDGVFTNANTRSLGLTKVGSGTLTLTSPNYNTGPVTVNGGTLALSGSSSFDTASSIIVGSGAFYDVNGAGGTVNRASGQKLGGSGTVNGNVVGTTGSIIAPGTSIGTLTVAGNVNLTGASFSMEVNRPGSSDKLLTSGGSITCSGCSLSVSNIGSALQVGDTFTFFAGGISGVTAPASTVDSANAVTYTWTDNLAGSGSISVASVTPIASPVLNSSVSGNTTTFSWTGPFKLQSQTNTLATGLSTNWANYPGGSVSPVNVTNNINNPAVFFRLSL